MNDGLAVKGESRSRAFIGRKVRELRKGHLLSQGELGKRLGISQSSLSEIELGQVSLSAEQFLQLLKLFNVPASFFDPSPGDVEGAIQKALAAHGANHLVEDPALLPSERLAQVDSIIRETLVSGENPRALTALAPVIIGNLGRINLPKLFTRFKDYGLENRYGWLIDNILAAIAIILRGAPPRKQALALARAAHTLQDHRARFRAQDLTDDGLQEDCLGLPLASPRTRQEVLRTRSDISRTWNLLTTLQVDDFVQAIQENHAADPH